MTPEAEETAKLVLAEVAAARRWATPRSQHDLFLSAETIIAALAFLIGPLMDAEQIYRQKVRSYIEAGKSAAAAEALAKSDDEYYAWKKLERVHNLGEQQIMLLKKFSAAAEDEYRRS